MFDEAIRWGTKPTSDVAKMQNAGNCEQYHQIRQYFHIIECARGPILWNDSLWEAAQARWQQQITNTSRNGAAYHQHILCRHDSMMCSYLAAIQWKPFSSSAFHIPFLVHHISAGRCYYLLPRRGWFMFTVLCGQFNSSNTNTHHFTHQPPDSEDYHSGQLWTLDQIVVLCF